MFHVEQKYKRDTLVFKVKDYINNKEEYLIYKDSSSGILWTDVPSQPQVKKHYNPSKYIPHSKAKGLFQRSYKIAQKIMFFYKRLLLGREIINSKQALDFGSGDGEFFKFISSPSLKIDALDPLFKANHIEQKNFYTKIKEVPDNQYDIVFMWHSLEHVQDLENTINEVYKKLKDNGALVVAFPNHKSFDASCYKENWAALDAPRHLWHFSTKSIKKLMLQSGFKAKRSFPLLFDAHYISYLSAANNKSYFPVFSGIFIGALSNFIGFFSGEFSSSAYVFKKTN